MFGLVSANCVMCRSPFASRTLTGYRGGFPLCTSVSRRVRELHGQHPFVVLDLEPRPPAGIEERRRGRSKCRRHHRRRRHVRATRHVEVELLAKRHHARAIDAGDEVRPGRKDECPPVRAPGAHIVQLEDLPGDRRGFAAQVLPASGIDPGVAVEGSARQPDPPVSAVYARQMRAVPPIDVSNPRPQTAVGRCTIDKRVVHLRVRPAPDQKKVACNRRAERRRRAHPHQMQRQGAPLHPDRAGSDVRGVLADPLDACILSEAGFTNLSNQKEFADVQPIGCGRSG